MEPSAEKDEASLGLSQPPQCPSLLLAAAGSRMVGIQEIAQLLLLSCQTGTGSEGSPGSTTKTRGSSTGRDEAGRGQWGDMDAL